METKWWSTHSITLKYRIARSRYTHKKTDDTFFIEGHRKRFPKLVKMSALFIKINFSQRYNWSFPRNKVTVVLKLALLASRPAALIENLRKPSDCDVMFDKHRRQTLAVTSFNPCYAFYIVSDKRKQWCIVPHIIVQMGLPVDGICTDSPKTRLVCTIGCETWTGCSGSQLVKLPLRGTYVSYFAV